MLLKSKNFGKLPISYPFSLNKSKSINPINTLHNISKKGLLFYTKRRQRMISSFMTPNIENDDITYYKQMKEFIKETEGVPKNSQKWWELRNKHYATLLQMSHDNPLKIVESQEKSFVRFYFIIIPEDPQCYELINLLNYYQFRYKALEDSPVSKSIIKQFLGFNQRHHFKYYNFPFLQFESSEEATQNIDGFNEILKFLMQNNLMHEYRTHSAYEKEGLALTEEFLTEFKKQFLKFSNKFSFYFRITNFTEARYWYTPFKDGHVYRTRIISRLYRLFKSYFTDFSTSFSFSKKDYKSSEERVEDLKVKFVERLHSNPFHGGDVPDGVDFKLYSLINMYSKCRKIHNLINTEKSVLFKDWYSKMSLLCSRSSYYNIKDYSYNYSEHIDKKLQEQEQINKKSFVDGDKNYKGAFANRKKRFIENI